MIEDQIIDRLLELTRKDAVTWTYWDSSYLCWQDGETIATMSIAGRFHTSECFLGSRPGGLLVVQANFERNNERLAASDKEKRSQALSQVLNTLNAIDA